MLFGIYSKSSLSLPSEMVFAGVILTPRGAPINTVTHTLSSKLIDEFIFKIHITFLPVLDFICQYLNLYDRSILIQICLVSNRNSRKLPAMTSSPISIWSLLLLPGFESYIIFQFFTFYFLNNGLYGWITASVSAFLVLASNDHSLTPIARRIIHFQQVQIPQLL